MEKGDLDVLNKHIFARKGGALSETLASHDAQVIGLGLLAIATRLERVAKALETVESWGVVTRPPEF